MKLRPTFDDSLEDKAVEFLKSVRPLTRSSADAFLSSLSPITHESLTIFVQSIRVLMSSPNRIITTTAMEILRHLFEHSSTKFLLSFVKADLMSQLIVTLNPLSLSFTEAVDIHTNLMKIITYSHWPSTPYGLKKDANKDDNEQQSVHETILKQVVVPSDTYILHLCVNRFSFNDNLISERFLTLLARLIEISPSYRPIKNFVLHMSVFLTIPSYLTFIEDNFSIWFFLTFIVDHQREWNEKQGEQRQTWLTVQRLLRMEGFEDAIEEILQNDKNELFGRWVVGYSIEWNNLQGMNLPASR